MAKTNKYEDMQPWLDYFDMLREYVCLGFLQMEVSKHEAFITQPVLHAISDGDDPIAQMRDGSIELSAWRLRAYAGWLAGEGMDYLRKPFAVHVVKPDVPHDLMFTMLLSCKRKLLKRRDMIETITYPSK